MNQSMKNRNNLAFLSTLIIAILALITFSGMECPLTPEERHHEFEFAQPNTEKKYITPGSSIDVPVTIIRAVLNESGIGVECLSVPQDISVEFNPEIIAYPQTLSTLTITADANALTDTHNITITGLCTPIGQEFIRRTSFDLIVNEVALDFSITTSPSSINILEGGGSADVTVNINRAAGYTDPINLTVEGSLVGAGVDTAFTHNPVLGNTSQLTITTDNTVAVGTYTLKVKADDGNVVKETNLELTVTPPDFSLALSPSSTSLLVGGGSTEVTVNINRTGGHTDPVNLILEGPLVGAGIDTSFITNPAVSDNSILTITTDLSVPIGVYNLTVKGNDGTNERTTNLQLNVYQRFTLSVSPLNLSIPVGGGSADATVSINRASGYTDPVILTLEGALVGAGIDTSFNPNPATGSTSTLTITTDNTVTAGSYQLTVKGNDGIIENEISMWLTVGTPISNWVIQASGVSENLTGIHFSDNDNGYVVGNNGTIVKTTDGGANWNQLISSPNAHFTGVQFFDWLNGFVVGTGGTISFTPDGGGSWEDKSMDTVLTDINNLYFQSQDIGWVVGRHIQYTTDGGDSWERQLDYDPPREWLSIAFGNTTNGAVVGNKSGLGKIYYTTNAKDWTESNYPAGISVLYSVSFVSSFSAFIFGRDGIILKSLDGGANWSQLSNTPSGTTWGGVFVDENNGWVFGSKIWKTADGGNTWIEEEDPASTVYRGFFLNSVTGYAVGSSGLIMRRN